MRLALSSLAVLAAAQALAAEPAQPTSAAQSAPVETYSYDMTLDIAKVIDISEPSSLNCESGPASITYLDHDGTRHVVNYRKIPVECVNP